MLMLLYILTKGTEFRKESKCKTIFVKLCKLTLTYLGF